MYERISSMGSSQASPVGAPVCSCSHDDDVTGGAAEWVRRNGVDYADLLKDAAAGCDEVESLGNVSASYEHVAISTDGGRCVRTDPQSCFDKTHKSTVCQVLVVQQTASSCPPMLGTGVCCGCCFIGVGRCNLRDACRSPAKSYHASNNKLNPAPRLGFLTVKCCNNGPSAAHFIIG